ncbi:hypothetical protein Tsedi_00590 [Tepidimonas sediminis]|uniref:FlgN protein n=1 Tax=Tepidimonas sediminis TaxID=2588941 RepID=A0A554WTH2_9BURK|nr:hypothetical protein [Tepidimonas sediminis]TSE26881.1 hypothetical protein Tsedi_00590 [Tepidimonas sediminis]
MQPAPTDPVTTLEGLLRELDAALETATRHAAGQLDADAFAAACERLAHAFVQARPLLAALREAPPAPLVERLAARLQTLHELQARLDAQARAALQTLLPQDALQAYARLGQRPAPRGWPR